MYSYLEYNHTYLLKHAKIYIHYSLAFLKQYNIDIADLHCFVMICNVLVILQFNVCYVHVNITKSKSSVCTHVNTLDYMQHTLFVIIQLLLQGV